MKPIPKEKSGVLPRAQEVIKSPWNVKYTHFFSSAWVLIKKTLYPTFSLIEMSNSRLLASLIWVFVLYFKSNIKVQTDDIILVCGEINVILTPSQPVLMETSHRHGPQRAPSVKSSRCFRPQTAPLCEAAWAKPSGKWDARTFNWQARSL